MDLNGMIPSYASGRYEGVAKEPAQLTAGTIQGREVQVDSSVEVEPSEMETPRQRGG